MNTSIQINEDIMARQQEAFMGKMLEALNGFFDIHTIYIGNRLGLYKPLAGPTALTTKELAVRTGNDERYVREWLEAQTVSGILDVDDAEASSRERRYRLPAGHTEVLCDQESVNYLAPVTRMAVGAALPLEAIVSAFRTGEGVSFSDYGADMRQGVGELNRPLFMKQLGDEYLLDVDNPIVVPVNRKVRLLLTSNDVIHAWWVPQLAIKKDAIPGIINETWFRAEKVGTYRGQCAELCGKDHGYMPIVVEVVEPEAFQAWVETRTDGDAKLASAE